MKNKVAQVNWDNAGFTEITKEMHPDKWNNELALASLAMKTMGFIIKE